MKSNVQVLTVNGGSSSIKFALFESGEPLRRILDRRIEGIGQPQGNFAVKGTSERDHFSRAIALPTHTEAVEGSMEWIKKRFQPGELAAVGHRVVHGGP